MYLEAHVTFISAENILIVCVTVIDELSNFCCYGIDCFYLFSGNINGRNKLDGVDSMFIVKFRAYSFFDALDDCFM